MRVPTWRTRMLPALASWPAYTLIPRRWPLLSRPFRVLPCPFLCAMTLRSHFDTGDPDSGEVLAVPLVAPVLLAALFPEDQHLLRPPLLDYLRPHLGARQQR